MIQRCVPILLCAVAMVPIGTKPGAGPTTYNPPDDARPILGGIVQRLKDAKPVDRTQFTRSPATYIATLPGGALYFEVAAMDVDDDGSSEGAPAGWAAHPVRGNANAIDQSHQDITSYGSILAKPAGQTDAISAFKVPYIVLPGGKPTWWRQRDIKIGDGAVVIRGSQRIDAVFADTGPGASIGEMSLRAHELFGEKVIVNGRKSRVDADGQPSRDPVTDTILSDPAPVTRNSASRGPFIVIVFPGTSAEKSFTSVDDSLKPIIERRFADLTK